MNKLKLCTMLIIILILIFVFSSCGPTGYVPSALYDRVGTYNGNTNFGSSMGDTSFQIILSINSNDTFTLQVAAPVKDIKEPKTGAKETTNLKLEGVDLNYTGDSIHFTNISLTMDCDYSNFNNKPYEAGCIFSSDFYFDDFDESYIMVSNVNLRLDSNNNTNNLYTNLHFILNKE